MGIPVVVVRGLLESGKTYFIKDSLRRGDFGDLPRTLILSQEEGVEEYDEDFLDDIGARAEYVDKENWNDKYINDLVRKHKPHVLFVEVNEMWNGDGLKFPEYFDIQQVMCIVDGTSFSVYFNALRQLFVDMVKACEVVVINRADKAQELSVLKKNLKVINNAVEILALDSLGNQIRLATDLPYDINAPVIKIDLNDFGDFYLDAQEDPERYNGREIELKCQAFFSKRLPPKTFVAGRLALTCCQDDIQMIGLLASYGGKITLKNEGWIKLCAVVRYVKFRGAPQEQVVLDVLSATQIEDIPQQEGLLVLR